MSKNKKDKPSILEVVKDVVQYKSVCEANVVGCLWLQPDLYDTYDSLTEDDFSKDVWKLLFIIGREIYRGENKKVLDDITTGLYLEKHPKMKETYEKYGGYNTIDELKGYVKIENLDGYIEEMMKWQKVLDLHRLKFPIEHMIDKIKDISLEELYNFYEAQLNHVFMSNVSGATKSHNLCEGIHSLIDECNEGGDVGFPITPKMLNDEINGLSEGNITIVGAGSGVGKTTHTIEWLFPNMIEYNEQLVMVINEQDEKKMRQELVVWVANNIFGGKFNKKRLRQGKFDEVELELLRKCADWIEKQKENKNITIIPLATYTVEVMIKIIKKYSALGVKHFVLDTFKESDDAIGESWKTMMLNMRQLYDIVKPSVKNVQLWITVQLNKGVQNKYLTQANIGMSKNIVDVASVVILMRRLREEEKKEGGLKAFQLKGANGDSKVPVTLNPNKNYVIIFLDKNRFGSSGEYQIVAESNLGLNTYTEVGLCVLSEDF